MTSQAMFTRHPQVTGRMDEGGENGGVHDESRQRAPETTSFLRDECGIRALKLAARGNTIIAELLRLSEHIPLPFTEPNRTEYGNLIFDFTYFKQRDAVDQAIADSPELSRLDEEFWQTHMELLDRFFRLFRSIFLYVTEVNRFVEDVKQGLYVSHSIDSLINGSLDGVQLLCELHHLYGVMLLLLDEKIGGKAREHLIVSHIRYRGAGEAHVLDVTRLCRSTGYEPPTRTANVMGPSQASAHETPSEQPDAAAGGRSGADEGYPVAYFARIPVHLDVVRKLLDRLRAEDIYRMSVEYPLPEHRGAAMSQQAALVYTLLFFQPHILAEARPEMADIVNKHFSDSWVLSYYLGATADLTVAWESFPAARSAIARTVSLDNVTYHQRRVRDALHQSNEALAGVLRDGALTETYVLDQALPVLLPLMRSANTTLRWLVLHGTRGQRPGQHYASTLAASYHAVRDGVSDDDIIALLLRTAQVEFDLKALFTSFLANKRAKWRAARRQAVEKMKRLSDHYAGDGPLTRDQGDVQLSEWFAEVAEKIRGLQYCRGRSKRGDGRGGTPLNAPLENENAADGGLAGGADSATEARRRLQKLLKALENVMEFRPVSASLLATQSVQEAREHLSTMLRCVTIDRKVLANIALVGDLSYAWEQLSVHGFFVKEIQGKIKAQPALSVQMRSVFVKLASVIELPCVRIDQACISTSTTLTDMNAPLGGGDPRLIAALEATSSYYSNSIVAFARRVLHVIPTAIFETLRKVMQLLLVDEVFKECPSKIARQDMKAMSQLPVRERLSSYTADIARYASGILAMESMRLGVTEVDSHQLLEDGIRRELVEQVARELHAGVRFDAKTPMSPAALEAELHRLGQRLKGIRNSFEYIQDYLDVRGVRVWLEEFARIVNFNVDMEANAFVARKIYPWNSSFQSESTPIPYMEQTATSATAMEARDRPLPARGAGGVQVRRNGATAVSSKHPVDGPPLTLVGAKHAYGFLGHLVQHLLALTDPYHAIYLSSVGAWFSRTSLTEVVGLRTFSSIGEALGPAGLQALDRLLCFIIAKNLQLTLNVIRRTVTAQGSRPDRDHTHLPQAADTFHSVAVRLCDPDNGPEARQALMAAYEALEETVSPTAEAVTETLVRIGRLQLMRRRLGNALRSCGRLGSGCLYGALRTANDALLTELQTPASLLEILTEEGAPAMGRVQPPDAHPGRKGRSHQPHTGTTTSLEEEENNVISLFVVATELSPYLDAVGITDTMRQLFIVPSQQPPVPYFVLHVLGLVLRDTKAMRYDDHLSACTPRRVEDVADPACLLAGVALLLEQFHRSVTDALVTCLAQAIRTKIVAHAEAPTPPTRQQESGSPSAVRATAGAAARSNTSTTAIPQGIASSAVVPDEVETLVHVTQLLFAYLGRPVHELQGIVPATMLGDYSFGRSTRRQTPIGR